MKKAVLLCWMTLIILSNSDSHAICVALCTEKAAGGINRARSQQQKTILKKIYIKKLKKKRRRKKGLIFVLSL